MISALAPFLIFLSVLAGFPLQSSPSASQAALPPFGRDTVLVYKSSIEGDNTFVVRIAQYLPDRHFEWEEGSVQGTILLPAKALEDARSLVNFQLFQAGVDARARNATTLWLSRRIYRELKGGQKLKLELDGIATTVHVQGPDQMTIEVNRTPRSLPVIKTKDEYGTERWFLDLEDNPLLVNLYVRQYQQKLTSITTDRPNTLRWIKDKKRRQATEDGRQ